MESAGDLQPGARVQFHGLQSPTGLRLNGKYGILLQFHTQSEDTGRWAVRCEQQQHAEGKQTKQGKQSEQKNGIVTIKPDNLTLVFSSQSSSSSSPPQSPSPSPSSPPPSLTTNKTSAQPPGGGGRRDTTVLPPLKDEWNLTDLSKINKKTMAKFRDMAANADTIEAAERAVFIAANQGQEGYEGMAFLCLFPYGTGLFAEKRPHPVRLEEYVNHLFKHRFGLQFLKDTKWLMFMTNRAAILRAATEKPPMYEYQQNEEQEEEEEHDPKEMEILKLFAKLDPMRTFCFRYLVGDQTACFLARLCIHDMKTQK
jgi:hypothetical protein